MGAAPAACGRPPATSASCPPGGLPLGLDRQADGPADTPLAPATTVRSHEDILGFRFQVLGSTGRIRVAGVPHQRAERFVTAAVAWLRDVESRLTRFSDKSLVGALNDRAGIGSVQGDCDLLAVLDAAGRAWRWSAGRLNATVLPLYRLWHDAQRTRWPDDREIDEARELVGWEGLVIDGTRVALQRAGMALDLGGVGKEWAVDQLIGRAAEAGIADCLVELGGDCRAAGRQGDHPGWWVALPGAAMALLLADEALATSGLGTRRRHLAGRQVTHLIDARTGLPASGAVRSATILAPTCLVAGIHASDCCLIDRPSPALIAQRSASHPAWCLDGDGRMIADHRLAARMHRIAAGAAGP